MRGDSSEQRARRLVLEKKFRKPCRRAGRRNSKSCESNRMPRQVKHRLQKFGGQFFPVAQKRLEQPPIGGSVDIQLRCCKIDITMQTRGGPIIERMRERDLWLNPGEPESIEWESFEKRRTSSEWMNCRAEIVDETGQRQFSRARAAANGGVGFQYQHGTSRVRENNGGRQTVRSGANDNGIIFNRHVEERRKSRSIARLIHT